MSADDSIKISTRIGKIKQYCAKFGVSSFFRLLYYRIKKYPDTVSYEEWLRGNCPTKGLLKIQNREQLPRMPFFVAFFYVEEGTPGTIKASLESFARESYSQKLLVLVGEPETCRNVAALADKLSPLIWDEEKSLAISQPGPFFAARFRPGDVYSGEFFYKMAKAMQKHSAAVYYCEHDRIMLPAYEHSRPCFKPDFNASLLMVSDYIKEAHVYQCESVPELERYGKQSNYCNLLLALERGKAFYHVPQMLFYRNDAISSWRKEENQKALENFLMNEGIRASVKKGLSPESFRIQFLYEDTPEISVIIPNKDHGEDLLVCVESLTQQHAWDKMEVIIVENNSTEEETAKIYRQLEEKYKNVKVVYWPREFNYSAITNFGVEHSRGEYLLLLNNDVQLIGRDGVNALLEYARQPDVGIVGAKLLFGDGTVQHGGVIVGLGGLAGHAFLFHENNHETHMDLLNLPREISAVTAAYMMTKRSVYEEVRGFYEGLPVAFNDIDYCMKVRQTGRKIIYQPYAQAYHYESKSRGADDTPEKQARFDREVRTFRRRWMPFILQGDPYYNRNLTISQHDYACRNEFSIPIERILEEEEL